MAQPPWSSSVPKPLAPRLALVFWEPLFQKRSGLSYSDKGHPGPSGSVCAIERQPECTPAQRCTGILSWLPGGCPIGSADEAGSFTGNGRATPWAAHDEYGSGADSGVRFAVNLSKQEKK